MSDGHGFGSVPIVAWTPWLVTGPLLELIVFSYVRLDPQPHAVIIQPDELAFLKWIRRDGVKLALLHDDGIERVHWALPGGEVAGAELCVAWQGCKRAELEHLLLAGEVIAFTLVDAVRGRGIECEHFALTKTDGRLALRDPIAWEDAA